MHKFLLFHVSLQHAFTTVSRRMRVVLLTQEPAFWRRTSISLSALSVYSFLIKLGWAKNCKSFSLSKSSDMFTKTVLCTKCKLLHQNAGSCVSSITRMRPDTLVNARWRKTRKRRYCWIKSFFCFLCAQKVFLLLHKIKVEPLMSHGLF